VCWSVCWRLLTLLGWLLFPIKGTQKVQLKHDPTLQPANQVLGSNAAGNARRNPFLYQRAVPRLLALFSAPLCYRGLCNIPPSAFISSPYKSWDGGGGGGCIKGGSLGFCLNQLYIAQFLVRVLCIRLGHILIISSAYFRDQLFDERHTIQVFFRYSDINCI
jgi:hypothetical protein